MGKVALYALAAFMETGIGIWLFGQVFPKRERLEKRHVFGEWILFAVITLCAYSFPKLFWGIANETKYIRNLIIAHLIIVFIYIIIGLRNKQALKSFGVQIILFIGMIVCITAQFWNSYHSYSMAIAGYIFPVFFLWVFYECSFVQAYLWEFAYITNLGILKNLYITYVGVFKENTFEAFFNWPRSHTYIEIIYLLIIYITLLVINKYIPLKDFISQVLRKNKISLFVFTLIEWHIFYMIIDYGLGEIKEKNLTISLIFTLIIVFCLTLLYIRSIVKISASEKKFLDMRNAAIERQYHELNIAYEKYRCTVHDEKHMLLYLQECLRQANLKEAQKFLDSYQGKLNQNGNYTWTGIANLDFLLNIKKQQIDTNQIEFHLDCQIENIMLEDADFVVLLGNLLDNAIEAAEKCDVKSRKIYLSIKSINEMFILKIQNSCIDSPRLKNHRFITSKENKDKHGWGIESIKHIVDKYHGTISFQNNMNLFEIIIII